tara:strand:- start:74 stop:622 length:549 start_codon:yes stop_codon:yes gene_type:complete
MTDYTQTTFFATKDNLASGDAAKVIKGSEVDAELLAIKTAVNSKTETGDIPSGSAMLFMQASAPVGWQQVTTHNDKALRVVSGTGGGTGGSVAFETALASHTVSISGTSGATTLVEAQIPIHNHKIRGPTVQSGSDQYSAGNTDGTASSNYGGGDSHTHSFSDTYALNLDVQYINVIVCTKD